jgi:hypothetical protein
VGGQAPSPVAIVLIAITALATYRSTAQIIAMEIFATHTDRASIERAARIDPSNYSVQMRLARRGNRKQRCEHALIARSRYPLAQAARDVSRGCRE